MTIEGISGVPAASKLDSESAWLESRAGKVSASIVADCYPAVGGEKVGYSYPTECWAKLVAGIDPDRFPAAGLGQMNKNLLRTGEMLQPEIEKLWLARHQDAVRVEEACETNFVHPEHSWLSATPDLVVRMPDGELTIVEVKTTSRLASWKHYNQFVIPKRVRVQIQAQMFVLGVRRAVVCLYPLMGDIDGESIWVSPEVAYDEEEWSESFGWAQAMHECVSQDRAPVFHEAYGGYSDFELGIPTALSKVHTLDSKEADSETVQLVEDLLAVKEALKEMVKSEKRLSALLKGKFGLARELVSEGRVLATYRGGSVVEAPAIVEAAREAGLEVDGLSAEEIVSAFPALVGDAYTESSYRRLLLKERV